MLSNKAKYGIKAMLYLSEQPAETAAHIADIAEDQNIPKKFLDLILLELKKNGLLRSRKGKGGGYQLAKAPDAIAVGTIIRILDGPLAPIPCVSKTAYQPCGDCRDENACRVRRLMSQVRDALAAILDHTTLADMCGKDAEAFVLQYDI